MSLQRENLLHENIILTVNFSTFYVLVRYVLQRINRLLTRAVEVKDPF